MRVIPVLDVLDGVVVHAIKGRRKEYKPLKSVICESANPVDVAMALKTLGFSWLYFADLNAITGKGDNFSALMAIVEKTGLQLMVDAGVSSMEKAELILQHRTSKIIIGTETLTNTGFIEEAISSFGAERVVVSLDTQNRQILGRFNLEEFQTPLSLLLEFQRMGLIQVVLLDLARVGSKQGIDEAFVSEVLDNVSFNLLVGGGVRDMNDLLRLDEIGVYGVLLATALYSGTIAVKDLSAAGFTI